MGALVQKTHSIQTLSLYKPALKDTALIFVGRFLCYEDKHCGGWEKVLCG